MVVLVVKGNSSKGIQAFLSFLHSDMAGGVLLFICALLAMIIANSPFSTYYFEFWHLDFGITIGDKFIGMSLAHWLNDVFMSIFFLIVGLEIKREFLFGELVGIKKASFPVLAALGGMIVPGMIFLSLNLGTPSQSGFGIPMATDIAFALGVIILLGKMVPVALKVFLVTLAVADDLGAIIVIGVFYTNGFNILWFVIALVMIGILILFNKKDVRILWPYLLVGLFLWLSVYNTGIHATIAAVALAFTIPVRPKINGDEFMDKISSSFVPLFIAKDKDRNSILLDKMQVDVLNSIVRGSKNVQNPLLRLEHALAPWSSLLIMPLFGFANAGVAISSDINFNVDHIFLGILLGLVVGKPLGILSFTFICDKLGLAQKPKNVSWIHILGAGMLAGIGFTMSIFVSNLAFANAANIDLSKLSILISSSLAALLGSLFISTSYFLSKKN